MSDILAFRSVHFPAALSVSHGPHGLKIVKGEGQYLIDDTGRAFVDCGKLLVQRFFFFVCMFSDNKTILQ